MSKVSGMVAGMEAIMVVLSKLGDLVVDKHNWFALRAGFVNDKPLSVGDRREYKHITAT